MVGTYPAAWILHAQTSSQFLEAHKLTRKGSYQCFPITAIIEL